MRAWPLARAGLALAVAAAAPASAHEGDESNAAPPLAYELPAVGSYELPPIERVGEHRLLDSDGRPVAVPGAPPGGVAVVGFVYLSCVDPAGCPLSLATLQRLDRAVASRPDLRAKVRIATVSFDPGRDDPARMAQLRQHMSPRSDWRFLTAASPAALAPVLSDFGQDAVPLATDDGRSAGVFRHVTKVFLVDDRGAVRNIYSTGFLDHRLVLRDIETLLAAPGE